MLAISTLPGHNGIPDAQHVKKYPLTSSMQDLLLPRTLTSRLARGTLPPNTSIQKDALLALTKAASVFISYLASHSNEVTTKKTIGPQDVLKAIQEIEMGGVMGLGEVGADGKVGGRLERELEVWETVVRGKRKGYREKVKQRGSGAGLGSSENGDGEKKEAGDDRGEPEAKRARVAEEGISGPEAAGRAEGSTGAASSDRQQIAPSRPVGSTHGQRLTNGAGKGPRPDNVHDDEGEDEEDDDDGSADGDETQPDEDDDPEDEEEPAPDEEELDGYGPEDQLRHDMNGDETEDESEG
jgi:DNA polymerase epsilon subunit 3